MADKAWKQRERQLAKFFGVMRTVGSGCGAAIGRGSAGDIEHPEVFAECKLRAKHAVWTLWRETKEKAKRENKLPVIALAEKNKPGLLLVVHTDDFDALALERVRALHGDLGVRDGGC